MDDDKPNIAALQGRLEEPDALRDRLEGGSEWTQCLTAEIFCLRSQLLLPTINSRPSDNQHRGCDDQPSTLHRFGCTLVRQVSKQRVPLIM